MEDDLWNLKQFKLLLNKRRLKYCLGLDFIKYAFKTYKFNFLRIEKYNVQLVREQK